MKYKKITLLILICLWMVIIFIFSSQYSKKSSNTSGTTIKFILDKLAITKNMSNSEIHELVEKLQTPVRKMTHFSIYMVGGIITYAFANQLNISNKKKILFSIAFGVIYAITDELHQYFVPRKK